MINMFKNINENILNEWRDGKCYKRFGKYNCEPNGDYRSDNLDKSN